MRDKYLSRETQPSPASLGCPAACSQALIWLLIGFRLEICMLITASNGRPTGGLDGAPGLVGKCQVGSGGKDSALGGSQHLLTNIRTSHLSCGQLTPLVLGHAAGGLAWTPHRTLGYKQGEVSGSCRLGSDANLPVTLLPTTPPRGQPSPPGLSHDVTGSGCRGALPAKA